MNEINYQNTGAMPSELDYRDGIAAASAEDVQASALPPSLFTDFSKFGVFMQAQTPACVSNAWAKLMQLWWYSKTGEVVQFSPRFLHIMSKLDWMGPEDGRMPRTVCKVSQDFGCATIATVPNDTSLSNNLYNQFQMTSEVMADAAKYKIPSYVPVSLSQTAFRIATQKYGGVSMLMEIGKEFWTPSWAQDDIDPIKPPQNMTGRHQTLYSGWNTQALERAVNSWSEYWDDKGEFNFIWNDWRRNIVEGWTIADIKPETLALLQTLPKAKDFTHTFRNQLTSGMRNEDVKMLQIALAIDGCFTYPDITGYYGVVTSAAVLAFQRKHMVDDEWLLATLAGARCGPKTLRALNAIYAQS